MLAQIRCNHRPIKRVALFVVLLLALVAMSGTTGVSGATTISKRYVAPTGWDANRFGIINNCLTLSSPCKTIGHALFVASPGDEILPAAGTYQENIIIGKNILIQGASLSSTVVDGRALTRVLDITPGVTATLSELTVQNGKESGVPGGGLSNAGALTLKHVIVSGNTSSGGTTVSDNGGGIWNTGTLTLESSFVAENHADNNGGGIYNQSGTLTVKSSVISMNAAGANGGGIENQAAASLTQTTVGNNSAQTGGGLDNEPPGTVKLSNVTFSSNTTGTFGSGAGMMQNSSNPATLTNVTFRDNAAQNGGMGGGLYTWTNASLTDVTFDSNFATTSGGMENAGGTVTLTNVTFSDNGARWGGGLVNDSGGAATLTNVTFSGNSTGFCGGAICNRFGTINMKNTIVANSLPGANCSGPITDEGHNLDSGNSCGFSAANHDLINTDPLLGPLQNNGGYTDTLALDKGSPAINKGTNTGCPQKDQRGKTRLTSTDPTCDIGAYEYP